jgi:hypothetical protein
MSEQNKITQTTLPDGRVQLERLNIDLFSNEVKLAMVAISNTTPHLIIANGGMTDDYRVGGAQKTHTIVGAYSAANEIYGAHYPVVYDPSTGEVTREKQHIYTGDSYANSKGVVGKGDKVFADSFKGGSDIPIFMPTPNGPVEIQGDDNSIYTWSGDDLIMAQHGNNYVNAGLGRDTVILGNGDNTVITGGADDLRDYVSVGTGYNRITAWPNDEIVVKGGHAVIGHYKAYDPANYEYYDGTCYVTVLNDTKEPRAFYHENKIELTGNGGGVRLKFGANGVGEHTSGKDIYLRYLPDLSGLTKMDFTVVKKTDGTLDITITGKNSANETIPLGHGICDTNNDILIENGKQYRVINPKELVVDRPVVYGITP